VQRLGREFPVAESETFKKRIYPGCAPGRRGRRALGQVGLKLRAEVGWTREEAMVAMSGHGAVEAPAGMIRRLSYQHLRQVRRPFALMIGWGLQILGAGVAPSPHRALSK